MPARVPYSPGDWRRTPIRTPAARTRARRRRTFVRRGITVLALLAAAGTLAGGLTLAVLLAWASRDLPDPSRLITRQVPQSTKIYDRTGAKLLYELHGDEQRTQVALADIAETAKWATIAVEDRRFYEHQGFRLRSVMRAILANTLAGGKVQGGSTITQQLIKNAILSPDRTYRRKLKELLLAERLEQKFTKDEILTMYFNEIPYGSTAYGIEAASRAYFGKSAKSLDLAESAMLAAIPKGPTYYSPYGSHREELVTRMHLVLTLMAEQGYITAAEADAGKRVDILARVQPKREPIVAPHFVMYVRELLTEQFGERVVEQGGLTVTTTLDTGVQEMAEDAVAKHAEKNQKTYQSSNAALVAIDVPTGQILAMVGSKDYFDDAIDGQVNVALRPRQPGSSFKPLVYASAFAKGYTSATLLEDVATTFPTSVGAYEPKNYDGKEHGLVTVRTALAGSLNIPAVKMLDLVGMDTVLDLADRLGYTTLRDRSRFGLSLVLGGGEVKLLEHTSAYAAFAADGIRRPAAAILSVKDAGGTMRFEWTQPPETRVLDAEAVRTLTNILMDNDARAFTFGTNSPLAFRDRPVAAKTGTTNDYRDAWTMGYTPSLAVGVWAGNNDGKPMNRAGGTLAAAPIWRSFLDAMLKGKAVEPFPAPLPIPDDLKPVLRGVDPGVVRVRIDRTTGKRATEFTPPELVEEREYRELHTILHSVRRDDPRGPPPERPEDDPMYRPWEDALHAWGERNHIITTPPPAETDDVHTEINRPTIAVTNPAPNAPVSGREVLVEGTASAPRGVARIEVRVDDIPAALFAPDNGSFRRSVRLPATIGRGVHTLAVTATDDVGNARTAAVPMDVQSDREPTTLTWEQPASGATIRASDFPVTIVLNATNATGATRLEITVRETSGERVLTSVTPPADNPIRILWPTAPAPGAVGLRARLLINDTVIAESTPREFRVER